MSLPPVLKFGSQKSGEVSQHRNDRHVAFDKTSKSDSFVIDMPESETDSELSETGFSIYAKKFFERAEKVFNKMDLKRNILDESSVCSSGLNDIPSTPIYSDTSIDSREKYLENSPTQGNLLWTVFMLSMTFFLQAYSRDFFMPFFEPALIGFPDWSRVSLGLTILWNPVVGLLLSVPSAQFINKYGIKTTLLFSCVLSTIGAGVRLCLPLLDDATSMIHSSTIFLTCASVITRPLTATVCTYCFRNGERNLVSATLVSSSMMGTAFGYLVRMKLDSSPFLEQKLLISYWKTVVMILMYTIFILSVLWTSFVYVYFPQESQIIRRGGQSTMKTCMPTLKFLWRTMLRRKSLLCVALAYALSHSWTWVWYQTIEVTLFEVGFTEAYSRDFFVSFFEPALIGFPDWSRVSLGLTILWNPVVGLLLSVPSAQFINKYGKFETNLNTMIHSSTIFLTCASVITRPLTATVCTCCFRNGERNLVSATLVSSSMMGTAFGYLVRMKFDSSPFLEQKLLISYWKTVVMILMYTIFILSVLWTSFVYVYFPQESQIIRRGGQSTMKTCMPTFKFLWRTMLRNKSLLCVALAYALSHSWTWVWYQTIEITLFEVGFTEKVGTDCRFWILVHTCMLALSIGWFADQLVEHKKRLSHVIQFFATACLLWVVCVLHVRSYRQNTVQVLMGMMFGFPLCWSTTGVMYEMAWQYTYPMPENMAVGVLEVFKYAGEIFAYAFMMFFPIFHLYWLHLIAVVAGTFSFVFILCAKRNPCNKYTF